ncbi:MAG: hypothetical protein ACR2OR_14960 [Hyphomicrobiales bacterium]
MLGRLATKLTAMVVFSAFFAVTVTARPMHVPRELGYTASKSNPKRRMTHNEARDECRKVYGRSLVARVQIKPSGKISCWVIY